MTSEQDRKKNHAGWWIALAVVVLIGAFVLWRFLSITSVAYVN